MVGPEEEPVPGAEVAVLDSSFAEASLVPPFEPVLTDGHGRATIHSLDNALIEASHPDYRSGRARLDIAAQVSHRLRIKLLSGDEMISGSLSIEGRVLDPEDNPFSGDMLLRPGPPNCGQSWANTIVPMITDTIRLINFFIVDFLLVFSFH